eukprot:jgi/Chrzof1/8506/Cz03g13180.t1
MACHAMSVAQSTWRLELFVKSKADVQSQIPFLISNNIMRINLPNKSDKDDLLDCIKQLRVAVPSIDIAVHYSIKYNYSRSYDAAYAKFQQFCQDVREYIGPGQGHVLLVSGGGKKRKLECVGALQRAAADTMPEVPSSDPQAHTLQVMLHARSKWPALYVAFNVYLPDPAERQAEYARLQCKLQTSLVQGIYLQIGTDMHQLQEGLDYVQQLCRELYVARGLPQPEVLGSVFVPTPRLLSQMRFRPWNGVYLSEEYLSGVEPAERITKQLLKLYAVNNVVPLVESAVRDEHELAHVNELLHV